MSFNSYQQITPEMAQEVKNIASGVYASKSSRTVWFNPKTQDYWAANDPTSMNPDYGTRITNPGKLKGLNREKYTRPTVNTVLGGSANPNISKTELDEMRYKGIWSPEYENDAVIFHDTLDRIVKK